MGHGTPAKERTQQNSSRNGKFKRAALSGVCGSGQHGDAGAAVPPGGDGHKCAVWPHPGAAVGLVEICLTFFFLNFLWVNSDFSS